MCHIGEERCDGSRYRRFAGWRYANHSADLPHLLMVLLLLLLLRLHLLLLLLWSRRLHGCVLRLLLKLVGRDSRAGRRKHDLL